MGVCLRLHKYLTRSLPYDEVQCTHVSTAARSFRAGGEPFFLSGVQLIDGGLIELCRPISSAPSTNGLPGDFESLKRLIHSIRRGVLRDVMMLRLRRNHAYSFRTSFHIEKPTAKTLLDGIAFLHTCEYKHRGMMQIPCRKYPGGEISKIPYKVVKFY
jgi:hypothetical protein